MPNTISVCMIAKNEEQLIGNSLGSVREIADEIIVVDTGSTDRTAEIAEKSGARIIRHQWDGNYGRARNAYLRAAHGDWILVLDGDEAIARSDLKNIKRLVRRRSLIGCRLTVRNYTDDYDLMWNWYPNDRAYPKEEKLSSCPGWMKTRALRLFRNFQDLEYIESSSAHTTLVAPLRKHSGRIENRDDVAIHHFQYLKGGSRFLSGKQLPRLEDEILHAKRYPQEPYPYLNIAKTLFAEKRDAEAVSYLSRAVKLDPSFYEAYQLRGMIEFENGRLSSAEEHLKRAIRIDPHAADAWALLGMVLVEQERPNAATHALKKALHLRPQHLLAHNSLGVLYEDMGMYREARKEYQAAIKLHPRFKPARANLARLMRTNGKRQRSRVRAAQ
jgi:O-antigen biosynthesis protein